MAEPKKGGNLRQPATATWYPIATGFVDHNPVSPFSATWRKKVMVRGKVEYDPIIDHFESQLDNSFC
jgi:hypothetical protein